MIDAHWNKTCCVFLIVLCYSIVSYSALSEEDRHESLQLGDKQPWNGASGLYKPVCIQLKLAPNTRGASLLCIVNYSNHWWKHLEDKQGEWILGIFQQPQATLLFWAPVAGRYTQLPSRITQNAPYSSAYSFIIFSHYCISAGPHSSIMIYFFFPFGDLFQLHPSPHLSLILTRSSDCIELPLHSSGGSLSCKYACPGSCCGCCALYSH